MELSENQECNLIRRQRCLYAHEMNSFIAVWRASLRLHSSVLMHWPDILQINLQLSGSLAFTEVTCIEPSSFYFSYENI